MKSIPVYHKGAVAQALVDDDLFEELSAYRWTLNKDGYATRAWMGPGRKTRNETLHRRVMGFPDGSVDHRNGDRLDCRRENLRVATHQENMHNRRRTSGSGASRFRGVHLDKGKWRAEVRVNGKRHFLGRYETEEEADQVAHEFRVANMPAYEARSLQ